MAISPINDSLRNSIIHPSSQGSLGHRILIWIKDNIIDPITYFFHNSFKKSPAIDVTQITSLNPSDFEHLAPYNSEIHLSRLPNLRATCYLNAALRMIASSSYFDALIETPLTDTNNECLRRHLFCIIDKIRKGERVSYGDMRTLYGALRLNQWQGQAWEQQDAAELLLFIFNTLTARPLNISVLSRVTWDNADGTTGCSSTPSQHTELSIGLPETIRPEDDATFLLQKFLEERANSDYRFNEEVKNNAVEAQFITNASSTLFVQVNRYCQQFSRAAPICKKGVATLQVTIYEDQGEAAPRVKEVATYVLKSIICRTGSSVNSGHYTTMVNENGRWIHYNDRTTIEMTAKNAEQLINRYGYYLNYERQTL